MTRRIHRQDPAALRLELLRLIEDFDAILQSPDLRERVLGLVPAVHVIRDLGVSLMPASEVSSARDRILDYLRRYPETVIAGDELAVVSGISEYARRIRELRVEAGWPIYSGTTARQMFEEDGLNFEAPPLELPFDAGGMKSDDYVLVGAQDIEAAYRWRVANDVRKKRGLSMRDRLLEYLRLNVGKPVTGEELRYVAKEQSWPRRTRELRTEGGWPVATRSSGRPDLPIGVYVLEADRQSEPHDRHIADTVRVQVLERDSFACRYCGWSAERREPGDPRALLELHHVHFHVSGGENEARNLVTLCNVHHDDVHRLSLDTRSLFESWLEGQEGAVNEN